MKYFLRILLVLVLCAVPTIGQAKEIPMWEGMKKTADQLAADKTFLDAARERAKGKMEIIVQDALQRGWGFIRKNNPDMAIKRFNQAWLIAPENPGVHWGFAIATDLQHVPLGVVERHFSTVENYLGRTENKLEMPDHDMRNAALQVDHGRVLEGRKKHKEAIVYFEKALSLNPNSRDAHIGMWMASEALGDQDTAEKHKKLVK